jgi:hypothetical protein
MTDNMDTEDDIKNSLLLLKRKFENEMLLNKYNINYINNIIEKNSNIDKNELFLCVIMFLIIASILSYIVKK